MKKAYTYIKNNKKIVKYHINMVLFCLIAVDSLMN